MYLVCELRQGHCLRGWGGSAPGEVTNGSHGISWMKCKEPEEIHSQKARELHSQWMDRYMSGGEIFGWLVQP